MKTFLRLCKVEWRKLDLYVVVKGLFYVVCCWTVSCQRSHLFWCFSVFCSNCRGVQESVETNWLKDLFYKIHAEPTGVNVSKVLIFTCVTQNHKRKNYEKYLLIILFLIVYSKQNLKLPYGKFQVTKFCFL